MMGVSFNARLIARVAGEAAVAVALLPGAWGVANSSMPDWARVPIAALMVAAPILFVIAAGLRQLFGGVSDIEISNGPQRFSVSGVRFRDILELAQQGTAWHLRQPMARPVGPVLRGSPADPQNVTTDAAAAALPATIEVAADPLPLPADAKGLSVKVYDDVPSKPSKPEDE